MPGNGWLKECLRGGGDAVSGCEAWSDASTWAEGSLHREVFFFESRGEPLYGSLYASTAQSRPVGLVICSSWGIEANRMCRLTDALARKAVKLGGAALLFHYPGYGDSGGRPESTTMEDLAAAAVDATAEASTRQSGFAWGLVGVRLGAAVAALARRSAGARRLLLIQPALDPEGYFEEVLAKRRRASLGRDDESRFAFGYPIPEPILRAGPPVASAVSKELREFDGDEAIAVQHATPAPDGAALERFERVNVPGSWRFGVRDYPDLKSGALRAVRQIVGGGE
jgi:hypothetical protein